MKNTIELYKAKKSFFSKKSFCVPFKTDTIAIIIPACNEYPLIFDTLNSIENSLQIVKTNAISVAVLCVVNNYINASRNIVQNNCQLIEALKNKKDYHFSLHILDCTTTDALKKNEGVGTARKYGMDLALHLGAKLLVSLDADTIVRSDYIQKIFDFYQKTKIASVNSPVIGAYMDFTHQKAENSALQKIITAYELFIKNHSALLKKTGSPYWAWSLGSALVCTDVGYALIGGMNTKQAGEDFYFLQAMIKVHIQKNGLLSPFPFIETMVYPSARYSDRTVFGTGQIMLKTRHESELPSYPQSVYEILTQFFTLFFEHYRDSNAFEQALQTQLPAVYNFLRDDGFFLKWENIMKNNKKNIKIAFFTYFDGLKTIRLIHYLCALAC